VGFYEGARGRLSGADIGGSLRGLPVANISGWRAGEATDEQMRGIASHQGPVKLKPKPAPPDSLEEVQRQLNACSFAVKVDGKPSRKMTEALRFFQLGWCGRKRLEDDDGKLTSDTRAALAWAAGHAGGLGPKAKNFHYQEFRLDNTRDPRVRRKVVLAMQAYRDRFGPTTIVSSARSVAHNQAVDGASNSRHLFPKFWDAIDPSPQVHSTAEVGALGVWTAIGHHAAAPQAVDHVDLRPGFSSSNPSVFPDH
jgi:Peptidase M15